MKKCLTVSMALIFLLLASVCFSDSSVMILINKSATFGAMGARTPAAKSAAQRIASYFVDKGIGVFDEQAMDDIYGELEATGNVDVDMPENLMIALAMKHKAEVLVKLEVFNIPVASGDETLSVRVIAKMFNVSNARLFAMSEQYGTNIIPNANAMDHAVTAAASKAGGRVGKRLYKKLEKNHPRILARLVRDDTPSYRLVFLGFTEDENDLIVDIVYDGIGLDEENVKENKMTKGLAELEIFTEKKFSRLVRKLKRILKKEGIEIGKAPVTFDKATFVKEGVDISEDQINLY